MRKLARQHFHDSTFLYLSPTEVASFHFLFIILYPPVSVFEQWANHNRVVSFSNEVLINYIWWWKNKLVVIIHRCRLRCMPNLYASSITGVLAFVFVFFRSQILWFWSVVLVAWWVDCLAISFFRVYTTWCRFFGLFRLRFNCVSQVGVLVINFFPKGHNQLFFQHGNMISNFKILFT